LIVQLLVEKANNEFGACSDDVTCEDDELIAQKYYEQLKNELIGNEVSGEIIQDDFEEEVLMDGGYKKDEGYVTDSELIGKEEDEFSIDVPNYNADKFNKTYMKKAVECFDRYGFNRVKSRFKRVKHPHYISRFRKYLNHDGTIREKQSQLRRIVYQKFQSALKKREITHDFELKRWAIQTAKIP